MKSLPLLLVACLLAIAGCKDACEGTLCENGTTEEIAGACSCTCEGVWQGNDCSDDWAATLAGEYELTCNCDDGENYVGDVMVHYDPAHPNSIEVFLAHKYEYWYRMKLDDADSIEPENMTETSNSNPGAGWSVRMDKGSLIAGSIVVDYFGSPHNGLGHNHEAICKATFLPK